MGLLYLTSILLCFVAINKQKYDINIRKYIYIFMLILFASVRVGYDTENYISMYNNVYEGITKLHISEFYKSGYAYMNLMDLFIKITNINNFFIYKAITLVAFGIPAISIINKYSANIGYLAFFYLISVFSLDAIQHRNMLALFLLIIAFDYLYRDEKRGTLYYFVLILIATIIHSAFIIYFVFILLKKPKYKKFINYGFNLGIIFCVVTILNGNVVPGLKEVGILLGSQKILLYLQLHTNYGFLFPTVIYSFGLLLVYYCKMIICKNQEPVVINNRSIKIRHYKIKRITYSIDIKRMANLIYNMNKLMIWAIPLCMISLSAFRIIRNLFIINLFLFTAYAIKIEKKQINKVLFGILLIIYSIGTFYYLNFILGPASDIFYAVLNGKLFLLD